MHHSNLPTAYKPENDLPLPRHDNVIQVSSFLRTMQLQRTQPVRDGPAGLRVAPAPVLARAGRSGAGAGACRTRRVDAAAAGNGVPRGAGGLDDPIELVNGSVVSGPDLSVTVNGVRMPNPFVIGSGPPGTNYQVRGRARFAALIGRAACCFLALLSATRPPPNPSANRHPRGLPQVMKKAFDEGWGGVICKTLSLDAKKVVNVTPRYAKLRDASGAVFGWENIELISDR